MEETQGLVKKKARTVDIPQAIQEETKEETKTVRPDVSAYYPIYSDKPGGWQADLVFIPYINTNLKKEIEHKVNTLGYAPTLSFTGWGLHRM